MNLTGIITEYNPFHLGHKYHLNNSIKDTKSQGVVSVMSGNFMQRGNPALIDKWTRAKIAVNNGVDLVLELPLVYSLSSAESFAYGGVKVLDSLNCINNIYFGSECGDVSLLKNIAEKLYIEPKEFKVALKEELDKGLPFHLGRKLALSKILDDPNYSEILSSSNNILGIEYIKALYRLDSSITPYTLKREGNNYNDKSLGSEFSSATSIREALKINSNLSLIKNTISKETFEELTKLKEKNYDFVFDEDIFKFLKYKLLTEGDKLSLLDDVKEGLDNKILKEIITSSSLEELILSVKSKRYTYTRISRILCKFFIGLEKYNIVEIQKNNLNYIRPLAFNKKGASILKEIKKSSHINIITKMPKYIDDPMLKIDLQGTKAYSILNSSISPLEDYFRSPYILKEFK